MQRNTYKNDNSFSLEVMHARRESRRAGQQAGWCEGDAREGRPRG